jgi:2-dehydro-3-deoxygluconokinase
MPYVDVCISNKGDAENVFGIKTSCSDEKTANKEAAQKLAETFGFKKVAITKRGSLSASVNKWEALLYDGSNFYESKDYTIQLVDRVGGGDSFAGALIYALISGFDDSEAVEFAVAASCLKQTAEFDYSQVTEEEVRTLMSGDGLGRVQR